LKFIRQQLHLPVNKKILFTLFSSYAKALETDALLHHLIAEHSIDTHSLYLYSYWMNNMAVGVALFKSKHLEVKAISRAHGWDVYFERHTPPYLPLRNFMIEQLDACYCISENGLHYLDALTNKNLSNHLKLSRLGTINAFGKRNSGNTDKLVIVSCSNIIPLKRIHLIIEALTLLKGIDVEWIHFGDGSLKNEIEQLAGEKLSSCANIKYRFAGYISNNELLHFYADNKIDLFINVSETEGLPVSIMEANSFGIPAIATNVGGVSEILQNGVNGFLMEKNSSPEKIAATIQQFYSLPSESKNKMKVQSAEIWNEKFNAEKNYKNFISSVLAL